MATLSLSAKDAASVKADALVVAVAQTPSGPRLLGDLLPAPLRRWLEASLAGLGVTGTADGVHRVPTAGAPSGTSAAIVVPIVVLTGVGKADPSPEALRRAAGAATRSLAGTATVALAFPAGDARTVAAVAEGALLGAYVFTRYRSAAGAAASEAGSTPRDAVRSVILLTPDARAAGVKAAARRAQVLADAVAATRDLVSSHNTDQVAAAHHAEDAAEQEDHP